MNSCAKSKSREYIEVMVTVTPSMTPTFLTFWFSGPSIDSPTIGASEDFEASKGPRNRPKPVWMNQETTARGPIEHDFLDETAELLTCCDPSKPCLSESHSARCLSLFLGSHKFGASKMRVPYAGSWMFPPSKKRDALGFRHSNGSWTFRPCTGGGF